MTVEWFEKLQFRLHLMALRRKPVRELILRLQRNLAITNEPMTSVLSRDEIRDLIEKTEFYNRNNLTRTSAYLRFYQQRPEIHWALLAHGVSRNGGYEMTDLHGDWFVRMSTEEDRVHFFHFLERANYLIFGDAFVQLLVYEESRRRGRPLFHVLPALKVSRFMQTVWEWFWETGDSYVLTVALIVNEQNFIDKRVVQSEQYGAKIIHSFQFQAQSLLNLTCVVFPFKADGATHVGGTKVEHFTSLANRIATGMKLYNILFHSPVKRLVQQWLHETPHSGSRADYWPLYFSSKTRASHDSAYTPKFLDGAESEHRIYSPRLEEVWPDVEHSPVESFDWFTRIEQADGLLHKELTPFVDFTSAYLETNRAVERILLTKGALHIGR